MFYKHIMFLQTYKNKPNPILDSNIDNGVEEGPEQPSIIEDRFRTTLSTKKNNANVIRVGDRVYTEILVLPLEEANELLASSNDQFELIVIKVIAVEIIGHQSFRMT
jgi:hypothetical protein